MIQNYINVTDVCKTYRYKMKEQAISDALKSSLSPLELDALKILLPDRRLDSREIFNKLKTRRKVAHSSVAVILDRLHKKGLLERDEETCRGGYRYIYRPVKNRKQYEKSLVDSAVEKLIKKYGEVALTYFDERFAKRD